MALASVPSAREHCRPGLALASRAPGPVSCFVAGLGFRALLDLMGQFLAIFQGKSPLATSHGRPGRAVATLASALSAALCPSVRCQGWRPGPLGSRQKPLLPRIRPWPSRRPHRRRARCRSGQEPSEHTIPRRR
eukprot:5130795-Pyramimonas_sp.AAC.1